MCAELSRQGNCIVGNLPNGKRSFIRTLEWRKDTVLQYPQQVNKPNAAKDDNVYCVKHHFSTILLSEIKYIMTRNWMTTNEMYVY